MELFACEARELRRTSECEDTRAVAAGERVLQKLREHLSRWFGADGFHTLLARALSNARTEHPVLAKTMRFGQGNRRISGFIDHTPKHGDGDAVRAALVGLIAALIALLSRLVGGDMAQHLVEQIWPDALRNKSSIIEEGGA